MPRPELQPYAEPVTPADVAGAREDAATLLRELNHLEATLREQGVTLINAAANLLPAIERAEEVMKTFLTSAVGVEKKFAVIRCVTCQTDLMSPTSRFLGKCMGCRREEARRTQPPTPDRHEVNMTSGTLPIPTISVLGRPDNGEDMEQVASAIFDMLNGDEHEGD